ncbi:MAG TPA: ankyrin repeat domain-containing protein, partial [Leptospiraceae bacterium]|nr:ankyrin repeat domain-containing protein [Leptospiraceae bacterium]
MKNKRKMMKFTGNKLNMIICMLGILLSPGCSSFVSLGGWQYENSPIVYSGIRSLSNTDLHTYGGVGETHLHWSVRNGYREITERMIAKGADVNVLDVHRKTPLHRAAENGNLEIAKFLITNGANVNPRDGFGKTPLNGAVFSGKSETIKLL